MGWCWVGLVCRLCLLSLLDLLFWVLRGCLGVWFCGWGGYCWLVVIVVCPVTFAITVVDGLVCLRWWLVCCCG